MSRINTALIADGFRPLQTGLVPSSTWSTGDTAIKHLDIVVYWQGIGAADININDATGDVFTVNNVDGTITDTVSSVTVTALSDLSTSPDFSGLSAGYYMVSFHDGGTNFNFNVDYWGWIMPYTDGAHSAEQIAQNAWVAQRRSPYLLTDSYQFVLDNNYIPIGT